MVLIDELLQISNAHRRATKIVDLRSVLLGFLFLMLKPLVVGDELFLHLVLREIRVSGIWVTVGGEKHRGM